MSEISKSSKRTVGLPSNFPLDCWCNVILFISEKYDYYGLVFTIKGLYHYIKRIFPRCTENIKFPIYRFPKEKPLHVTNLSVNSRHHGHHYFGRFPKQIQDFFQQFDCSNLEDVFFKTLKIFTNLRRLEVLIGNNTKEFKILQRDSFERFPTLRKLSLHLSCSNIKITQLFARIEEVSLEVRFLDGSEVYFVDVDWSISFPEIKKIRLNGYTMKNRESFKKQVPKLDHLHFEGESVSEYKHLRGKCPLRLTIGIESRDEPKILFFKLHDTNRIEELEVGESFKLRKGWSKTHNTNIGNLANIKKILISKIIDPINIVFEISQTPKLEELCIFSSEPEIRIVNAGFNLKNIILKYSDLDSDSWKCLKNFKKLETFSSRCRSYKICSFKLVDMPVLRSFVLISEGCINRFKDGEVIMKIDNCSLLKKIDFSINSNSRIHLSNVPSLEDLCIHDSFVMGLKTDLILLLKPMFVHLPTVEKLSFKNMNSFDSSTRENSRELETIRIDGRKFPSFSVRHLSTSPVSETLKLSNLSELVSLIVHCGKTVELKNCKKLERIHFEAHNFKKNITVLRLENLPKCIELTITLNSYGCFSDLKIINTPIKIFDLEITDIYQTSSEKLNLSEENFPFLESLFLRCSASRERQPKETYRGLGSLSGITSLREIVIFGFSHQKNAIIESVGRDIDLDGIKVFSMLELPGVGKFKFMDKSTWITWKERLNFTWAEASKYCEVTLREYIETMKKNDVVIEMNCFDVVY